MRRSERGIGSRKKRLLNPRAQLTLSLVLALASACAKRPAQPVPMSYGNYVDLQAGWRIRVITPILKSGRFKPDLKETAVSGGAVELSAGDDLVGYQTSYYAVTDGKQQGVDIKFVFAANTVKGETTRTAGPLLDVLKVPITNRFVRIVFLTRISQADHNQAILTAPSLTSLGTLTELVQADPVANCMSATGSNCMWVPEGIAVRPEKPDPAHHKNWVAAM
jgi:hypothetical protein